MPGGSTPYPRETEGFSAGNFVSLIPISSFTAVLVEQVNGAHCWEQVSTGERSCTSPRSPGDVPWLQHGTVGHQGVSSPGDSHRERKAGFGLTFLCC